MPSSDVCYRLWVKGTLQSQQISLSINFNLKQGEMQYGWASTDEETLHTDVKLCSCARFYCYFSSSAALTRQQFFIPLCPLLAAEIFAGHVSGGISTGLHRAHSCKDTRDDSCEFFCSCTIVPPNLSRQKPAEHHFTIRWTELVHILSSYQSCAHTTATSCCAGALLSVLKWTKHLSSCSYSYPVI